MKLMCSASSIVAAGDQRAGPIARAPPIADTTHDSPWTGSPDADTLFVTAPSQPL
jgi:hypothetical protein